MDFNKKKKEILSKEDKSRKGSVDKRIKSLCEVMNNSADFATSSSCAGRILLLKTFKLKNKLPKAWIWVTHEKTTLKEVKRALEEYNEESPLQFKQESAILHVYCGTLENAETLMNAARESGFKRSGIITTKKQIVVEVICREHVTVPIYDKKLLVTEEYLRYLIAEANRKLEKSWKAIKTLEEKKFIHSQVVLPI